MGVGTPKGKGKGWLDDVETREYREPAREGSFSSDGANASSSHELSLEGAPGELAAGTMVGEYRIEGKVGHGAMGVVYGAVHPVIGKRAAVKVMRSFLSQSPE